MNLDNAMGIAYGNYSTSLNDIGEPINTKAVTNSNQLRFTYPNIRFEKGVNEITPDLKAQKVTVTYDPAKTNKEKLVEAFKKIGYKATAVGE